MDPTQKEATTKIIEDYVDSAEVILGLHLPPEYRAGVIQEFDRLLAMAKIVLDFPVPEDTEIPAAFQP